MLDRVGGLFECGDMGSGDHHMALRMVGKVDASPPGGVTPGYRNAVTGWANLASNAINGKLGFAYGTIEHPSTAASPTAAISRAGRCSSTTASTHSLILKHNTYGVLEFSGSMPDLERAFDRYLRCARKTRTC